MALTMTRTRTQTALSKMADLMANINGELEFVRALRAQATAHQEALTARESVLRQKRDAVMAAIRQFDPDIDPELVGPAEAWRAPYKSRSRNALCIRYLERLNDET